LLQQLGVTTITASQRERGKQARHALVEHGQVLPAGLVAERTGQPRLADPGRTGQQTMPPLTDPVAAGQLQEQRAIQAARRAVIDILDRGQVAQPGGLGTTFKAFLLAQRALAPQQNAQPLGMAERPALRVVSNVAEAFGHAVQAELVQQVERWMVEQSPSP
jgi:hypothetical protein